VNWNIDLAISCITFTCEIHTCDEMSAWGVKQMFSFFVEFERQSCVEEKVGKGRADSVPRSSNHYICQGSGKDV
jgi:hypothetical protein